jgi:hypothetical protein
LYYSLTKGIIDVDPETGLRYYIDPISMIIANIQESSNSTIVPLYYKVYNKIIPKIYDICKFWTQLSGVAAYAVITRIGKRYCPSSKMALDFPTYYRYDRTNFYIFHIECIIFKHLY